MMAKKAGTELSEMRRCTGAARFGIEPHEAPLGDFPVQPKSRDGYGPMCKPHWTEYTRALRKARQAAASDAAAEERKPRARTARKTPAESVVAEAKRATRPRSGRSERPNQATAAEAAADMPASAQRFVENGGGQLPPAAGIEVVARSDDGFEAIIGTPETPET
jgi:hypothetical protein